MRNSLQRPNSRHALAGLFQQGGAYVKGLIGQKYIEALKLGRDWAVRAGLRNRYNWIFEGSQPLPPEIIGSFADTPEMKITFVTPTKSEPIDITPNRPAADAPQPPGPIDTAQPDYRTPALTAPRDRTIDPGYGLGPWRTDPDPNGWMK